MGAASRRKGGRVEREIVALLKAAGIPAERVPLSGAAGGSYTGDVIVGKKWKAEVKARKSGDGFKTLEGWLGTKDLLVLKRNNAEPMVLLPWSMATALLLLGVAMGPAAEATRTELASIGSGRR